MPPGEVYEQIAFSGDNGGGVTPVPIPNTAVKPSSADGTWPAGAWKSRSLPELYEKNHVKTWFFSYMTISQDPASAQLGDGAEGA